MTGDNIERARRAFNVFGTAVELDGEPRASFLAEACANDAALRAQVDALLAGDRNTGDPFAAAAWVRCTGSNAATARMRNTRR